MYTNDTPDPSMGCEYFSFADDQTQLITYEEKSREDMARKTRDEINKLNEF